MQTVEVQADALHPGQGPKVTVVQRCGSGFFKALCIQELIKQVVIGKCITDLEGQYKRKAGFLMEDLGFKGMKREGQLEKRQRRRQRECEEVVYLKQSQSPGRGRRACTELCVSQKCSSESSYFNGVFRA